MTAKKALLGIGGFVVIMGVIGAMASPPEGQPSKELIQQTSQVKDAAGDAPSAQAKKPVVEVKTIEEVVPLPYQSTTQNDSTLAAGKTVVAVAGVPGEKVLIHTVTYTDGVETARQLAGERITRQPVTEVTKIGTKVAAAPKASNCDTNYSGCVPIASDVDCMGGSGNGPAYVRGPVRVIGSDIYDLDRDGNGIACE